MKKILFIGLGWCFFLTACSDDDGDNPVIVSLRINDASNEVRAEAGGTLTVETLLQDTRLLGSYNINISGVFDGIPFQGKQSNSSFFADETFDATNRQNLDFRIFNVPQDATAGLYEVVGTVRDNAGNDGDVAFFDVIIENENMPDFELLNPNPRDIWEYHSGDTLPFVGGFTDVDNLVEIKIALFTKDKTEIIFSQTNTLQTPNTIFSLADFTDLIIIPNSAQPGVYRLHITARDEEGNITIFRKDLRVI